LKAATASRAKRAVAEFAIVVLGVATALAAENSLEGLAERRTEVEYLARLQDELRAGRPALEEQHARVLAAIAAMDTLLDVDQGSVRDLPMLLLNSAGYHFVAASVILDQTYREMLATGALNLVTDPETRAGIPRYFRIGARVAGNLEGYERNGHRAWLDRVHSAIGHSARTVSSAPELLDPEARARLSSILEDTEWQPEVRRTRVGLVNMAYWMERLIEGTDEMISLLAVGA
jgi:hypothetical protein